MTRVSPLSDASVSGPGAGAEAVSSSEDRPRRDPPGFQRSSVRVSCCNGAGVRGRGGWAGDGAAPCVSR